MFYFPLYNNHRVHERCLFFLQLIMMDTYCKPGKRKYASNFLSYFLSFSNYVYSFLLIFARHDSFWKEMIYLTTCQSLVFAYQTNKNYINIPRNKEILFQELKYILLGWRNSWLSADSVYYSMPVSIYHSPFSFFGIQVISVRKWGTTAHYNRRRYNEDKTL